MSKPMSAQRARERALFLYNNALERGDFETVSKILKQAERDPILERMIADLNAQAEFPAEQPEATTRILHKSDGIEQVITIRRPSSDGLTLEPDHSEEDRHLMNSTTSQEFEPYQPRPRTTNRMRWLTLMAAALVVALMGVLTVIVFRSGFVSNPLLTQGEPTPTPTPPPQIITRDNVGQLQVQRVFGYGLINTLNWQADDNRLVFTTLSGIVGFLNPQSLNAQPDIFQRRYLSEGGALVVTASLSPDGKTLALADMSKKMTLWDMETGEQQFNSLGNFGVIRRLAFSPDGAQVAGGSLNNMIYIWNAQTGDEIAQWSNPQGSPYEGGIYDIAFSPDGEMLAVANADHTVKLWDVATGNILATFLGHKDMVYSVAFSPNGNMIASGGKDGMVLLWDWRAASGTQHVTLRKEGHPISRVVFDPDGKTLAAVSADNTIYLWDVINPAPQGELTGHTATIIAITFSPDGKQLASTSIDETVRLWDVATHAEAQQVILPRGQDTGVLTAAFSPDGKLVVSGGTDSTVRLWDVTTGIERFVLQGTATLVSGVAFSPDGTSIVSTNNKSAIRLWDATSGAEKVIFEDRAGIGYTVAFSPDGLLLASGSTDLIVRLWDARTGELRATLKGHALAIRFVAFSPDGALLASASVDHTIRLWDVASGTLHKVLEGHSGAVWHLAFSPDGKTLASSGADRVIRLWDIESGSQLKVLQGHTSDVFVLAYSPDGSLLVSGSGSFFPGNGKPVEDPAIRLWDVTSGEQVGILKAHGMSINAVSFSPDGTMLLSASDDGTIRLWGLPPAGG